MPSIVSVLRSHVIATSSTSLVRPGGLVRRRTGPVLGARDVASAPEVIAKDRTLAEGVAAQRLLRQDA